MLVVGSTALKKQCPDYFKDPNDFDVVAFRRETSDIEDIYGVEKILKESEYSTIFKTYNTKNVEVLWADGIESLTWLLNNFHGIASLEILFSMKKGHIHWPIKFEKHILDYCFLGDKIGYEDKYPHFTKLHQQFTAQRLGDLKTPKLVGKKTKKFFDQSDKYVKSFYVHDDMHVAMTHVPSTPIYTFMQKNDGSVMCHRDMWNELSEQYKQWCVMEEAYVIALERKILPAMFDGQKKWTAENAFKWALMRICTTLCSGWFRQYACDNYTKILKQYDPEYINKFFKNIKGS